VLRVIVVTVLGIGYATPYGANEERSPGQEREIVGIPFRYLSLIAVSYIAVVILAFVLGAPQSSTRRR